MVDAYINLVTLLGVLLASLLILVKCYDNKMIKATPHLFHPSVDSALGGQPTKSKKKTEIFQRLIIWDNQT